MIWLPIVGNYAEIDAYASILAYTDLLNQRGKPAKAYIPKAPNYSVPATLRLRERENTNFNFTDQDQAIILDVSNPEAIHRFVPNHQILELIDHHFGYEDYWKQTLGDKAIIEPIGAVATSIFEWWGKCWDYEKMSVPIAKLLLAAILDNTLNFNAEITTQRDHNAATKLADIIQTPLSNFSAWYFDTVSQTILKDPYQAINDDRKVVSSPIDTEPLTFYQLTLWNARNLSDHILQKINPSENYILSIISISEKSNYIFTSSTALSNYFTNLLKLTKHGQTLRSNSLYLRKEILAKMQETSRFKH